MLKELIEYISSLSTKARPPVLELKDNSGRSYIYDDNTSTYDEVERFVARGRSVSNVESLSTMVIEEARRAGYETELGTRAVGDFMTVIFNKVGAEFHLDDRDARLKFLYLRELAPQWQILIGALGKDHKHPQFVRLLQSLRPSLVDYSKVILAWRKIQVDASSKIESAPTFEEGKAGGSYRFEMVVKGGKNAATEVCSTLALKLPVTRASKAYTVEVEITLDSEVDDQGRRTPLFGLVFPDRAAVEEQAADEEVAWFREQVKSLTHLSILEDY